MEHKALLKKACWQAAGGFLGSQEDPATFQPACLPRGLIGGEQPAVSSLPRAPWSHEQNIRVRQAGGGNCASREQSEPSRVREISGHIVNAGARLCSICNCAEITNCIRVDNKNQAASCSPRGVLPLPLHRHSPPCLILLPLTLKLTMAFVSSSHRKKAGGRGGCS